MDIKIRTIDLSEQYEDIKNIIDGGASFPLIVTGNSMSPFFVHMRDTVFITKPKGNFKKGDIVFYIRDTGQFVMHRVHHIDKEGYIYMVGDAQSEIEGPLEQSCIFGIVKKAVRKGKYIGQSDGIWKFFEKIWIRIVPIRVQIRKVASLCKRIGKIFYKRGN